MRKRTAGIIGLSAAASLAPAGCTNNTPPTPCPSFAAEATTTPTLPNRTGAERTVDAALFKLFGMVEGTCESPQQAQVGTTTYLGHDAITLTFTNPSSYGGTLSAELVVADQGSGHALTSSDILSATLTDSVQTQNTTASAAPPRVATKISVGLTQDGTWDVARQQPGLADVEYLASNTDATQQTAVEAIINKSFSPLAEYIIQPGSAANVAPFGATPAS